MSNLHTKKLFDYVFSVRFFIGWHQPVDGHSGCKHFSRCMISYNGIKKRRSNFLVKEWILDSGAFTIVSMHGTYAPNSLPQYASAIIRWSRCGKLLAAVTQDYMCENFILAKTGMTVEEHQRFTIYRYDALRKIG